MFTAPGFIGLTDEELLPFKVLTGKVYMGEAEATGENAIVNATKQAISMSSYRWFEDAKEVLVHILGSSEIVDMTTASEAVSVIREVAKESNCIFGVHIDDSMGKTVRITVVAKIP